MTASSPAPAEDAAATDAPAAPSGAAASGVAAGGGTVLAALTAVTARLRRARKPLHPRGFQLSGSITREGCTERWDVAWLDEPGDGRVRARLSRGIGLPPAVPDFLGLALRIGDDPGHTDLLLATTGRGRLTRFLLVPQRAAATSYGTLMPYRTPTGAVVLGAELLCDDVRSNGATVVLSAARPRGAWHRFATVRLDPPGPDAEDPPISFDPVRNPPPGLPPYDWTRRLRERAYATARRSRGETSA